MSEKRQTKRISSGSSAVEEFVGRLSEEQRMLVILKAQLYGGRWEPMLEDLHNRLEGKPYIFKLVHRIQDDIERIEQMRLFEKEHKVDLADYVRLSE
jgi:aspartate aminotransferase-like enzyme